MKTLLALLVTLSLFGSKLAFADSNKTTAYGINVAAQTLTLKQPLAAIYLTAFTVPAIYALESSSLYALAISNLFYAGLIYPTGWVWYGQR